MTTNKELFKDGLIERLMEEVPAVRNNTDREGCHDH